MSDQQLNAVTLAISQAVNNINTTINNKFPSFVAVPTTATSPGVPGQISYNATGFFVCVSSNVWVKATLATF